MALTVLCADSGQEGGEFNISVTVILPFTLVSENSYSEL